MQKLNRIFIFILAFFFLGCTAPKNKKVEVANPTKPKADIVNISDYIYLDESSLKVVECGINGVFNPLYAMSDADKIISYIEFLPLLAKERNSEFTIDNSLSENYKKEGKFIKLRLRHINWWDHKPVTSEDVLFSLKTILNKKYVGNHKNSRLFNIVGAKEYYEGRADTISGFHIIDDKNFKIELINSGLDMQEALYIRPIPEHYYADENGNYIEELNDLPLGNGPYKIMDYEANNFCMLEATDNFPFGKAKIENVVIREELVGDLKTNLYSGEVDILNINGKDEIRFDKNIRQNYNIFTLFENNSVLLKCVPSGDLKDAKLRKFIFSSIQEDDFRTEPFKLLKYDVGLICLANDYYGHVDMPYDIYDSGLNRVGGSLFIHGEPFILNIYYTNVGMNEFLAERIAEKLKTHGIATVTNKIEATKTNAYISEIRKMNQNALILQTFQNGIRPDYACIYDGAEFMGDPQENKFQKYVDFYNTKPDENISKKYKVLSLELIKGGWVRGIGSSITRTYIRRNIRNIYQSEYYDWYENKVWRINWADKMKKGEDY